MNSVPTEESVLDAFSVEARHDSETIQRYLKLYPQYALALVDLSRELSRDISAEEPLSKSESAWIEKTMSEYQAAKKVAFDPLAQSSTEQRRTAAKELGVPRQVITALIERKVAVGSITQRTLKRLAVLFSSTVEELVRSLSGPQFSASRSYKADAKPSAGDQVSLEQVLREAGTSEDIVLDLLKEDQ
jgi:hypothetical protein